MPAAHHRVTGGDRNGRAETVRRLDLPPVLTSTVDAHRRLRGPYTAAGTLLRSLAPELMAATPDLVTRHDLEILAVAPELRASIQSTRETLTSLAERKERTRFYSPSRVTRLAHGLTELIRDFVTATGPRTLVVENVDHADATDVEFLSIVVRRVDPALLTVVLCGAGAFEMPGATRHESASARTLPDADLAAAYVAGECLAEELRPAYEALDPEHRAKLHNERAAELEALGEPSLSLGAIPFHRELGGEGAADALLHAAMTCNQAGFYAATIELGYRARKFIGWDQGLTCMRLCTTLTNALAVSGRTDEVAALYAEARRSSTHPVVHMRVAYSTAMFYTRYLPAAERDDDIATGWANLAIAIATTEPDREQRAFQTAFMRNGLALVEVHRGDLPAALRLVEDALALVDAELEPGAHQLHRSVLRHNHGQVCAGLGRDEEALADFTAVIEVDPNHPEYYFDRAAVLRKLGRDAEALADYERVMWLSPPFPEVYYNRGDLLAGHGDVEGALADFAYALELDPEFAPAYVNRAGLWADLGEPDLARPDVEAGLALDPDNPQLHCVLGRVEAAAGHHAEARRAYDTALAADPGLRSAWAGLAELSFDQDDATAAVEHFDRALALGDDPALRFNRATALAVNGRWDDAVADLRRAVELDPDDQDARSELDRCLRHAEA
ncbi:tetratricopeptide repeat protein [Amycolatopsis sp. cg5]|uniref:tetratricopeptide repeat protein n=1 Tax=Amycolatopsis sp. cg5 TaxID=3238802 RepID=UPI00352331B3